MLVKKIAKLLVTIILSIVFSSDVHHEKDSRTNIQSTIKETDTIVTVRGRNFFITNSFKNEVNQSLASSLTASEDTARYNSYNY